MENVILIVIVVVMAAAIIFLIWSHVRLDRTVVSVQDAPRTTVNVAAGSVVKIRHASDGLELKVSGEEPELGPLSDNNVDLALWERITSGNASHEEKLAMAEKLRFQGIHVTFEGEEPTTDIPARNPDAQAPAAEPVPTPVIGDMAADLGDEGPDGDLVPAPLSASVCLDELQAILLRGLRSGECSPAFAREVSREYGFEMTFEDPTAQAESRDEKRIEEVRPFREKSRINIAEAMREYHRLNAGASAVPAASEQTPDPAPAEKKAPLRAPVYDFSNLK